MYPVGCSIQAFSAASHKSCMRASYVLHSLARQRSFAHSHACANTSPISFAQLSSGRPHDFHLTTHHDRIRILTLHVSIFHST
eukprot:6203769-Pleurochrysis_carterae.AAC.1